MIISIYKVHSIFNESRFKYQVIFSNNNTRNAYDILVVDVLINLDGQGLETSLDKATHHIE